MNPVIEAAWIAASSTGVIGIIGIASTIVATRIGSRTTERITGQTLSNATENALRALDAARDDRLWDTKADVYADALQLLRHRVAIRRNMTRDVRFDEENRTADKRRARQIRRTGSHGG